MLRAKFEFFNKDIENPERKQLVKEPQARAPDTPNDGSIRATVGKVRGEGDRRFAVAYLEPGTTHPRIQSGESITFSLTDWRGDVDPRKGQVVMLESVQRFAHGWRALCARPISLEPQATRREQS